MAGAGAARCGDAALSVVVQSAQDAAGRGGDPEGGDGADERGGDGGEGERRPSGSRVLL